MVGRIDNPCSADLERFLRENRDIAAYLPQEYLDLVLTAAELDELRADFPGIHITQTEAQLKHNLLPERDIPGYHNYNQMVSELMQIQAEYPSLMQTSLIGSGWGAEYADENIPAYLTFDHDIWAVKVSANVLASEDEPAFYFVGEHHAREPLSTEVCLGLLSYLLENYGTDPVVTGILNSSEIWIVPLLNPDGHKIVTDQSDVWWRKNIRDNNGNQAFDHQSMGSGDDGVDLNRNYSYQWGYASSSDNAYTDTYHGPAPFSEPETQALRSFLLSRRWLAGIEYHTYGELVLYPYGYVNGILAPDVTEMQALANDLANLLPGAYNGHYNPGPSWGLYPASGTMDDWTYSQTAAFAYTIEMAQQFIPPASQVPQIVQNQVSAALALIQRKDRKILRGHITDAITAVPLRATVFIDGFDNHPVFRAPICSDSLFGAYYYLLPPGEFSVHYICPGYETEIRTVSILPNSPTIQDVSLTPTTAYPLTVQIQGQDYAPLAGATLVLEGNPGSTYVSDDAGNILIGDFHPGEYQLTVSKPSYEMLQIRRHISTASISLRIAQTASWTDTFELGIGNWISTGSWNTTSTDCYEGSYSLTDSPAGNYQNNSNSTLSLASPLDLQNIDNANLQFWIRTSLVLDGDNLLLETSADGATWNVLDFFSGTSVWVHRSYNLNSFIGQNLHLRFRLYTNSWGPADGIYIDDLRFFASTNVTENNDASIPPFSIDLSVHPNPFSTQSTITVKSPAAIPSAGISIYNLKGQQVRRLENKDLTKGSNSFIWDGLDQRGLSTSSGVYLLRVSTRDGTLCSGKILRLK